MNSMENGTARWGLSAKFGINALQLASQPLALLCRSMYPTACLSPSAIAMLAAFNTCVLIRT